MIFARFFFLKTRWVKPRNSGIFFPDLPIGVKMNGHATVHFGRYQTLFRDYSKFLNFEKIFSASFLSLEKTPTAKI